MRTYRKRTQLAEEFDFSHRMMEEATKGLRKHAERYPNGTIRSKRTVLIDKEMFLDWLKYREALERGVPVPAFRREEYQ